MAIIIARIDVTVKEWQNSPLKPIYTFLYVDCIYVTVKNTSETKQNAVYVILGIDLERKKEVVDLWIAETEGKH